MASTLTLTTDRVSSTVAADNSLAIAVSLSPNPVSHMLMVSGLNTKEDYRITIADMSGYVWMNTIVRKQSLLKTDMSRLKEAIC